MKNILIVIVSYSAVVGLTFSLNYEYALMASSCVAIVALIMSWQTAAIYGKSPLRALFKKQKLTYEQWLMLGIFFTHGTEFIDGAYWLPAWNAVYLNAEHPLTLLFVKSGVYSNIPFRFVGTIAGTYCHLRAAASTEGKSVNRLHRRIALFFIIGGLHSFLLALAKNAGVMV